MAYITTIDWTLKMQFIQYSRAYDIYFSLGNYFGEGLALYNLGETYLLICEYQKCRDSLEKAKINF